jgi:hypothetical protein
MKLLRRIFKGEDTAKQFDGLVLSLQQLRQKTDMVLLSPRPTGYSWLGVYNGGKSMFPDCMIDLPHYYSNSLFSDKQLINLVNEIAVLNFSQVLLNGFPPYYELLVEEFSRRTSKTKIGLIYHGFPAELSGNKTILAAMSAMVKLAKQNKIRKIGFAKKGFALTFEQLFGVKCFEMIYKNPGPLAGIKKYDDGKIHIGVLVSNFFRKNFHTQVMAALMIENSVIHVIDDSELGYLDAANRIVAHGHMQHTAFIQTLASMDITFHVTFSEASGGQVCSESISQGVPCISAYTSSFFDYNDELKKMLIPEGFDDPWPIYLKAKEALKHKDDLSKKCLSYAVYLNQLADERIEKFLAH